MNSPLHRQLLTVVAILGGMGLAFVVSNHVSIGVPKSVSTGDSNKHFRPKPEGQDAEAWLFYKSAYPNKSLPPGAQEKAWRQTMKARAHTSSSLDGFSTGDNWTSVGPASVIGGQIELPVADPNPRVSARIYDIAVDPTNATTIANHWFIATWRGGIWETTNGGGSWTPKTDGEASLAMKTITIAPSNPQLLFATTSNTTRLLKSVNGGATWSEQFTFPNAGAIYFAGLEVHPTNPKIVLAMIYNNVQANGGVYKSADGGTSFEQTELVGPGTDLAINPQDFNQQYAAIRSESGSNTYNGIYRSLDEGNHWTRLTGANGPWEPMSSGWGARVAIAPSNPDTVYVFVPGGNGGVSASQLWKTDNAWADPPTWTALPICQPGAETVMVDPADPNILYIGEGGYEHFHRFEAGTPCNKWVPIWAGTHVDTYSLKAAGSTILVGNDGGLWASDDQGTSWFNKNSNLCTIQFYEGSLHPTRPNWMLGGSQDNGSEISTGNAAWDFVEYGDGAFSAFASAGSDPDHNWLVSAAGLDIYKVVVTGPPPYRQYSHQVTNQGGISNAGAGFFAPIRRSPHSDVLLAGSNKLWKSTDFFTATQPTWTANGPEIGPSPAPPLGTIAFAPSDTSSLTYAYSAGSELRLTTVGGDDAPVATPWTDLDPKGYVPNRWVEAIAFDPSDAATIYVALNGYDTDNPSTPGHIFKTTNALDETPTWVNVTPVPPGESEPLDEPILALAIDPANPSTIYAGANIGVWKSTDGGDSWIFLGPDNGMPNLPVFELLFSPADGLLVAFTHGRGAFKLNAGSLQVMLTPRGAVMNGAKWNVDGGPFQTAGTILPGLAPGNHTVTFSPATGYLTPANQTVTISANQTTQATGVYFGGQ